MDVKEGATASTSVSADGQTGADGNAIVELESVTKVYHQGLSPCENVTLAARPIRLKAG